MGHSMGMIELNGRKQCSYCFIDPWDCPLHRPPVPEPTIDDDDDTALPTANLDRGGGGLEIGVREGA